MRAIKVTLALVLALAGMQAAAPAMAHGGHHGGRVHFGVFVGAPAYWYYPRPYYYYPPYYAPYSYYYPPVASSPPVYIERGDSQAAPEPARDYWYYCPESNAYYPYVKQCARGWQRVTPQPPSG